MAHVDDVGPVRVAIHQDEEILWGIGAEICCKFLKWSSWSGFDGDGFPRVRWQVFLALLASEDNFVDVVQPWPAYYRKKGNMDFVNFLTVFRKFKNHCTIRELRSKGSTNLRNWNSRIRELRICSLKIRELGIRELELKNLHARASRITCTDYSHLTSLPTELLSCLQRKLHFSQLASTFAQGQDHLSHALLV